MQTLLNKQDGFGKAFIESMPKKRRRGADSWLKSVKRAELTDKVVAKLGDIIAARVKANSPVATIWKHFRRVVPMSSATMRSAADYIVRVIDSGTRARVIDEMDKRFSAKNSLPNHYSDCGVFYQKFVASWEKATLLRTRCG